MNVKIHKEFNKNIYLFQDYKNKGLVHNTFDDNIYFVSVSTVLFIIDFIAFSNSIELQEEDKQPNEVKGVVSEAFVLKMLAVQQGKFKELEL